MLLGGAEGAIQERSEMDIEDGKCRWSGVDEGGGDGRFVAKHSRLALALRAILMHATAVFASWENVKQTCAGCRSLIRCLLGPKRARSLNQKIMAFKVGNHTSCGPFDGSFCGAQPTYPKPEGGGPECPLFVFSSIVY